MKWKWNTKENNVLRAIIIVIALFLDFGLRFLPAPSGMSQDAFGVIGVFAGSLLLWLTISIDWPSILCVFALALLPSFGLTTAFTSSFGSETFIFLIFTFVCTYALSKTSVIKRISIWFVSNKIARKNGWLFVTMFLLSVLFVGMFMSPTVLFMILIPILEQILEIAKIKKGEKVGKLLYIGMAFCVSISSGMTPIAHVFPIYAMNAAGLKMNYLSYMAFAIPVGLVVFALMLLMFRAFLKPDVSKLANLDVSEMKNEMPKLDLNEILILSIFVLVVFLWITPSICIDNHVFTIILFSIFAILMLSFSISLIAKGKKEKSKLKLSFGIVYTSIFCIALIATMVLLFTKTFNLFEELNKTNISFLILLFAGITFFEIYNLAKSIKNKKYMSFNAILSTFLVVFCILFAIFPNYINIAITYIGNLKTAMPPIFGTILLCMIRVKNEPLVTIQDSFKNGVPWSSLMMCAGTLTLGAALSSNAIGLKTYLQQNLTVALDGTSQILLLVIFVVWALIQTNLSSNMVTASLVAAVANTLLVGMSSTLVLPAVISIIGMLSAYAFATPPSMPHIAITTSSGYASTKDVFKFGAILIVISLVVTLLVGYPIASILMK